MARKKKTVIIIGGGLIGLASAYYLSCEGYQVKVIERDSTLLSGASEGNAGMVVPSHFIPLAAPGVIGQGLKWMLNPSSPFFLRPRIDWDLFRWVTTFLRHANAKHVEKSTTLLRDLGLESRRLHAELARDENFPLVERGLLMLCESEKGLEEEIEVAEQATKLGLEVSVFSESDLKSHEPELSLQAKGGIWFEQDCHLSPIDFITALRKAIVANGGEFIEDTVEDFQISGDTISAAKMNSGKSLSGDEFVLAGGVITNNLSKKIGLKLPMQSGKGYSLTLDTPKKLPRICSLLKEGRVAVTPMGKTLRVAGTMEICGNERSIRQKRLQGIINSFCRVYRDFEPDDFVDLKPWVGLRPCSPDGLPYIGEAPNHRNVTIASGHSMLGLSLAPITGKLVSQMVSEKSLSFDFSALNPARFG